ncbi:MAG: sulfotransferase family protein [Bacteroidales bacterium]
MKDSYLTAGIKLDQLFRLLQRNRVTYNSRNIFRVAFLLQSACWSSLFSWVEKAKYTRKLKTAEVPRDPIFIIGHWRTGSTFLHQLLSLDSNLCTPSLFQVAVPDSFLVSYPYYRPIFKQVVAEHRPMDQVKIGMDEPQEDEYAIYRMTDFSPLENLVFPKSTAYFLNNESRFLPPDDQLDKWKKEVLHFFKKLHFSSGKRIVSKNPFNSFRIKLLYKMFPQAKFINIVRDPFCVVPSTIHMWSILGKQNSLNTDGGLPEYKEVAGFLKRLTDKIEQDGKYFPSGTMAHIRFEELEANPAGVIRNVYRELGLPFTDTLEYRINEFMKQNSTFKKNVFSLTDTQKSIIASELHIPIEN